MDRTALARKRREDAAQPARPPIKMPRSKWGERQDGARQAPGNIRIATDSSEMIRLPRNGEATKDGNISGIGAEEDSGARHFHVANVAGGTLFLKPNRMPLAHLAGRTDTSLDRSRGVHAGAREGSSVQKSDISGSVTPRQRPINGKSAGSNVPLPPLSLSNVQPRRQSRSHSFSTVSDHVRSPTFTSNDFDALFDDDHDPQRPESTVDMSGGYLDLRIPHYRLGTPRFSGTRAYLHNSMYTSTTDDGMRSSVFSRAEFDKLFPAPPGQTRRVTPVSYASHEPRVSPNLHARAAYSRTPSRTPSGPPGATTEGRLRPSMYDRIEANPNSPSMVRYASTNGRILAATTARLISQITSPQFLDYELLSDFFLTYRAFLSPAELFDYLITRMEWALAISTDIGRIVRVRTFVAFRHWILNYFSDDFAPDWDLRERVCIDINGLSVSLRRRQDQGGSDINIVGELKKCWRRTCASFWPASDALEVSPDVDISPGGPRTPRLEALSVSQQKSLAQAGQEDSQHFTGRQVQWAEEPPQQPSESRQEADPGRPRLESVSVSMRTASIPTSPLSQQSMQILSCSIPFLRHPQPSSEARASKSATPVEAAGNIPPNGRSERPSYQHKRSGSFSDALRDEREPISTTSRDNIELASLATVAFSGGLLRGLLLQPCPAKLSVLVPISPKTEPRTTGQQISNELQPSDHQGQHLGVKRIVGDMRRALSSRKGGSDSITNSRRSGNSSDSRSSAQQIQMELHRTESSWQQVRRPPRFDVLGSIIEDSYAPPTPYVHEEPASPPGTTSFDTRSQPDFDRLQDREPGRPLKMSRLDSHVTTGSRSIVIVDGTKPPDNPLIRGAIPSVSSWSSDGQAKPTMSAEDTPEALQQNVFSTQSPVPEGTQDYDFYPHGIVSGGLDSDYPTSPQSWRRASDMQQSDDGAVPQARISSNVHPGSGAPPPGHQLRRRPAGDLKAYDHVHELEPLPRRNTDGPFSASSRSLSYSRVYSGEISGTHVSGQGLSARKPYGELGLRRPRDSVNLLETHSAQPPRRASFEAEAIRLARLGRSLDGGIEDALMKLEGRYGRVPRSGYGRFDQAEGRQDAGHAGFAVELEATAQKPTETSDHDLANMLSPSTETMEASICGLSESETFSVDTQEPSVGGSSAPLVAASLETEPPPLPNSSRETRFPIDDEPQGPKSVVFAAKTLGSARPSEKQEPRKSESAARSATPHGSFLLDDNESLSDISTDIEDPAEGEGLGVRSFFFDDTVAEEPTEYFHSRRLIPPASTGPTSDQLPGLKDVPRPIPERPLKGTASAPKILPSVEKQRNEQSPSRLTKQAEAALPQDISIHLPFVLAFESDVIAEQLTIIEKDALDEIAWQDLVGLRWQQKAAKANNWIEYLSREEPNGIDIVIARFNLVVKWVVSECILTQDINERAGCIVKYIHIASHCHRLRNYASMYQIVLALLSSDLAKLTKTWARVAEAEKQILSKLESLCQPLRNFHNLRAEMETDTTEQGCIPFIGLYTHDLVYNAQKPAQIDASPPGSEPLVNFERYQMAATIVKSLLRMLEASSKYVLHPHPEVLSRCLWLAALDDGKIAELSKALEQ